jgi:hypothetical protein
MLDRIECIVFTGAVSPVVSLTPFDNDTAITTFTLTPIRGVTDAWTWDARDAGGPVSCDAGLKIRVTGGSAGNVLLSGLFFRHMPICNSVHGACDDDTQWYSPEYSAFARVTNQESRTTRVPNDLFDTADTTYVVTTRYFDTISWPCSMFIDTARELRLMTSRFGHRVRITDALSTAIRLGCIGTYNYGTDTASLWLGQIANTRDEPVILSSTSYIASLAKSSLLSEWSEQHSFKSTG